MSQKINLQELAHAWVQHYQIDEQQAEAFSKTFFALIIEALEKEGYVKIKGLGTFKLIGIESRESINVNTGERFEIQEHKKVSFTPDNEVRDRINKPFSHFETVILNNQVSFDDLELEPAQEAPSEELKPSSDEQQAPSVEEQASPEEDKQAVESKPEPVIRKRSSNSPRWIRIVFMILIALAIGYMLYDLSMTHEDVTNPATSNSTGEVLVIEDLTPDGTTNRVEMDSDSVFTNHTKQDTIIKDTIASRMQSNEIPVHADSTSYTIIGIKASHVLKEGETLIRVSLRYYGTKDLWPYLLIFNRDRLPNPNVIKVGTVIHVPELKKK